MGKAWNSFAKSESGMQGEKVKRICHEAFLMTVMSATFGALPRVQFMHSICRFEAQEVKKSNTSNGARFRVEMKEL